MLNETKQRISQINFWNILPWVNVPKGSVGQIASLLVNVQWSTIISRPEVPTTTFNKDLQEKVIIFCKLFY